MMKAKSLIGAFLGGAVALAALLGACQNPASPSDSAATGTVKVTLDVAGSPGSSGTERTVFPDNLTIDEYALLFTPTDGGKLKDDVVSSASTVNVTLEVGTYTLTVTARKGGVDIATGTKTGLVIVSGQTASAALTLGPKTGGASGTFSYDVTVPAGASGALTITTALDNVVVGEPIALTAGSNADTVSLLAGEYRLAVILTNADDKPAGFTNHVVYSYSTLTSAFEREFTDQDFVNGPDPDPETGSLDLTFAFAGQDPIPLSDQDLAFEQGAATTFTLSVVGSEFTNINWYLDEEATAVATGASYTPANNLSVKKHLVTVNAVKGGKNYSEMVEFTVTAGALAIATTGTGIMDKGGTRQFTANRAVTWSVEGGDTKNLYNMDEDTKSVDTTISDTGLLTIAADETNITLTVRATSGEDTKTETVKVKGWQAVESVKDIFGTNPIYGVSYGAGVWVAVGGSGTSKIAYSTDGESWTGVTSLSPGNVSINNVVYDGPDGNKKFIALAEKGVIYYSTDGMSWANAAIEGEFPIFTLPGMETGTGTASNVGFNGAAYGNGMFIAVARNGDMNPRIGVATSNDGMSWTLQDINTEDSGVNLINNDSSSGGYRIAFHNGVFIVPVGTPAVIAKTTTGADMELAANYEFTINSNKIDTKGYAAGYIPTNQVSFRRVIFAGSQWIVTGTRNYLAFSSAEAESWTAITPTNTSTSNSYSLAVASYGSRVVIAGIKTTSPRTVIIQSASVPLSATSTWEKFEIPTTSSSLNAIAYGDNKVIVAAGSGWMAVAHGETLD
jgi:hypothetical protein